MAFTSTPSLNPQTAYRPILFETAFASADPAEFAIAQIFINGAITPVARITVPAVSETPLGTYNFRFDFQQIIARLLAPKTPAVSGSMAGALGAGYNVSNPDLYLQYQVQIQYRTRNPLTGFLETAVGTDSSALFYAISATRQHEEIMNFNIFRPSAADEDNRRWLTNAPLVQKISLSENAFVSFLHTSSPFRVRVSTYNSSNVLLQTSTFAVPYSVTAAVNTVAVGPGQLLAQFAGVGITTFAGVAYYIVELEDNPAGTRTLQTRRYNITESCSDTMRLHWFNLLGGGDSFTFKLVKVKRLDASFSSGQRPLAWAGGATPHSVSSKGAFRLASDGVLIREAETGPLSESDAAWLSELLLSNEVYRETAAGLVPVVVRSTRGDISRAGGRRMQLGELLLEVEDANGYIVQGN